jgi:hypothetical protein
MLAASPADARDLLAEMLARPVQADGEIVAGQAKCGCNLSAVLAFKIDALEQFPILAGQGGQQALEALAQDFSVIGAGRLRQLQLELLQSALVRRVAAIEIDHGMAENAIKPGNGVFPGGRLIRRSKRLRQALLHDILRQMRISDTAADKCREGVQIGEQGLFQSADSQSKRNTPLFTRREIGCVAAP